MGFFTFIICFLILLLIVIVIGSIQQFSLWIVTKKDNEFVIMIIPALISFISFIFSVFLTCYILNLFNINTINILFNMFMKWDYNFNNYITMLLGYVACSVIFIILQSFCLKLVNIDYKKIFDFIKHKIFKKEEIKTLSSTENEPDEKASIDLIHNSLPATNIKLSFLHYISASLLTFSIIFFSIFLLLFIGTMLGEKYII